MIRRPVLRFLIILLLLTLGLILEFSGLIDARQTLEFARSYSQHWWLIAVLILVQAILFTLALAGAAEVNPPTRQATA